MAIFAKQDWLSYLIRHFRNEKKTGVSVIPQWREGLLLGEKLYCPGHVAISQATGRWDSPQISSWRMEFSRHAFGLFIESSCSK